MISTNNRDVGDGQCVTVWESDKMEEGRQKAESDTVRLEMTRPRELSKAGERRRGHARRRQLQSRLETSTSGETRRCKERTPLSAHRPVNADSLPRDMTPGAPLSCCLACRYDKSNNDEEMVLLGYQQRMLSGS